VWDSKYGINPPYRQAHHTVLPTKTSWQCIQFAGSSISLFKTGSHVPSISFVNLLVCAIFVVVTLLMVSLSLIAWCHFALISPSERAFSYMTLLHLSIHIRYADSGSRIWKSQVGPWCMLVCCLHQLSLPGLIGCRLMLPHPSIVPRVISGQGMFLYGQRDFARSHMSWVFFSLHCVSM